MKWPDQLPDNCPPDDAKQVSIKVYMLVSSPTVPEDFFSLRQRNPGNMFSNLELECQAHGISVFENIEHVRRVKRRIKRLRDRAIGACSLTPDMGVLKPTSSQFGNSHRTWWVPIGIKPWEYFEIIER